MKNFILAILFFINLQSQNADIEIQMVYKKIQMQDVFTWTYTKLSETLIPPCCASCYPAGSRSASTIFYYLCVSPEFHKSPRTQFSWE
ncbi:hypothetical protein Npun_F3047 [Nostoc punctiforme PCC 73102]|uniref:Uncharacterized protein n=1 Tax=Nostoc punctiforme (strain ATCC 29133 / PCC 73102) TaxID=63737 RepID=B2IXL4_NOSP7|nr:hypothetical protein Npun_F3047 [Nostoc punctiforme PCC 73102]